MPTIEPIEVIAANILAGKIKLDDVPSFRRRSVTNLIRIAPPESIKVMAENRLKNQEDERSKVTKNDNFIRTNHQLRMK